MAGIRRTHARPPRARRRPCSARTCSPCWPPCPSIFAGFVTAPSCSSASRARCAAPRSSGWIADRGRRGRWRLDRDPAAGPGGPGGLLLTVRGKTGWRNVEVGRGSSDRSCPVAALETWLRLGRIAHGPRVPADRPCEHWGRGRAPVRQARRPSHPEDRPGGRHTRRPHGGRPTSRLRGPLAAGRTRNGRRRGSPRPAPPRPN